MIKRIARGLFLASLLCFATISLSGCTSKEQKKHIADTEGTYYINAHSPSYNMCQITLSNVDKKLKAKVSGNVYSKETNKIYTIPYQTVEMKEKRGNLWYGQVKTRCNTNLFVFGFRNGNDLISTSTFTVGPYSYTVHEYSEYTSLNYLTFSEFDYLKA